MFNLTSYQRNAKLKEKGGFFFFFNLLATSHGMWDLIPHPGIKPVPTVLDLQNLKH